MLLEFLFVLEALDDQEGEAEQNGNDEVSGEQLAFAGFGGFYCQDYRYRTNNQDGRIDGTHRDAELLAAGGEGVKVLQAIDEIGAEHAAEEHDFRHQKQPHAERGGIFLLLRVRKVVEKGWVMAFVIHCRNLCRLAGAHLTIVQREPPVPLVRECLRSYRPPKLQREFRRS